jgi:hypothetical protein
VSVIITLGKRWKKKIAPQGGKSEEQDRRERGKSLGDQWWNRRRMAESRKWCLWTARRQGMSYLIKMQ